MITTDFGNPSVLAQEETVKVYEVAQRLLGIFGSFTREVRIDVFAAMRKAFIDLHNGQFGPEEIILEYKITFVVAGVTYGQKVQFTRWSYRELDPDYPQKGINSLFQTVDGGTGLRFDLRKDYDRQLEILLTVLKQYAEAVKASMEQRLKDWEEWLNNIPDPVEVF